MSKATFAQKKAIVLHELSGKAQGTTYAIKYYHDKPIAQSAFDSLLHVIDLSMSLYHPNSLISKFNKTDVRSMKVDAHMQTVLKESFRIHKLTKGCFDITVMPLVGLWGFGPEGFLTVPKDQEVDSVMRFVGMDKIRLKGDKLYKINPLVKIDLNGIAQGYTVDFLAKFLSSKGVNHFLVELGGEIRTTGQKPDGSSFKIQLDETTSQKSTYNFPILSLRNRSVTSSGIKEKSYRSGNKIISHHINPKTGSSITSKIISVTVMAKNTMLADGLDNYFMMLSPDEAIKAAERLRNIDLCLYYLENNEVKVAFTSNFNNYIYKPKLTITNEKI